MLYKSKTREENVQHEPQKISWYTIHVESQVTEVCLKMRFKGRLWRSCQKCSGSSFHDLGASGESQGQAGAADAQTWETAEVHKAEEFVLRHTESQEAKIGEMCWRLSVLSVRRRAAAFWSGFKWESKAWLTPIRRALQQSKRVPIKQCINLSKSCHEGTFFTLADCLNWRMLDLTIRLICLLRLKSPSNFTPYRSLVEGTQVHMSKLMTAYTYWCSCSLFSNLWPSEIQQIFHNQYKNLRYHDVIFTVPGAVVPGPILLSLTKLCVCEEWKNNKPCNHKLHY